jgi:hypothetical protein
MLHLSPKSFLKSSSRLGDPWTDRCSCACGFELRLLCSRVADSPQGVADGPRGAQLLGVCRVHREFFRRFPSICLFWWFWSPEVRRTVCEESANGPPGADGLRVLGGRSIFSGALLEVLEPILDNLPRACGRSAWSLRTVHPLHADGPPRPLQTA